MSNILINGLNLSIGGGKNILDNYIEQLFENNLNHTYYVLTPNNEGYKSFSKEKLIVVDIENRYKKNIFFIGLYFFGFPRLLKKLQIDLVFNFGDVIIPTKIPQIYFFDWAYAVYSEKYIWEGMAIKDFLLRKTKVFLIDRYISSVKITLAQTKNISNRLKLKYNIENVKVIPTPIGFDFSKTHSYKEFNLPENKKYFLYPATFSTHKNFDVLIRLGNLIMEENLPFLIVLTIDEIVGADFIAEMKINNLDCIFNVGKIAGIHMPSLYQQCDVLLFPTLLETYGLPYIEAMGFEKPILTSNLDFAHAICDDVAFYFDPFDAKSILKIMSEYDADNEDLKNKVIKGREKVAALPDWKEAFKKFEEEIEVILNKK